MTYDRHLFGVAHNRFLTDAKTLTDDDLQQLALVDPALADRARARRAGYVKADDGEKPKALPAKFFMEWIDDFLIPILKTHVNSGERLGVQADALTVRITSLEGRILELEAALAAREAVTHADD